MIGRGVSRIPVSSDRLRSAPCPLGTAARADRTGQTASIEPLRPDDIADPVAYIVTRDRRVAVNEVLVRAAEQNW